MKKRQPSSWRFFLGIFYFFFLAVFSYLKTKNLKCFQIVSELTAIGRPHLDSSAVETLRYALSLNIYGKSPGVPWIVRLCKAVRKTCRRPADMGRRRALACLFQARLRGEMRPMPVVQVHNKKEAQ
ncbi:hypothetical protein [Pseudomonas sp. HS6]|uniref:hypothetical protein n=1 Tax=Pseudomonas sp. HS6 TaxID=2850559 RepID=UPI002019C8C3|nr:hypothetical protein [Pseudomonas sp. HS6]UQS15219.1 hypothetical protein JJN09_29150 [Pseudomonas sp. HS6]